MKYILLLLVLNIFYVSSFNNFFIMQSKIKSLNKINYKINMSLSSTNKVNTLIFNIYNVEGLLINKNFSKILLNLRNDSFYYINENNHIEQINNSSILLSNQIKNILFTDLNNIINNTLGIAYNDQDN